MHHEANADISTFYLRGFAMTTTLSCTGPQIQHAKDSAAQEQERSRWYVSMKPETGFLVPTKKLACDDQRPQDVHTVSF